MNVYYSPLAVLARKMRLAMGFSSVEPIDMLKVYRVALIAYVKRPLKSNLSGVFVRSGQADVVLINSSKSLGHQNFTLAHEIFHARHNNGLETRSCHVGTGGSPIEQNADEFASHLLLPFEGIQYYLAEQSRGQNGLRLSDVIYLEQLFGVSHKATLVQLQKAGLVTADIAQEWEPGIQQNAKHLGYDVQLYRPTHETTLWSDYAEKAQQALEANLISFGKYEEILGDADLLPAIDEENGLGDIID